VGCGGVAFAEPDLLLAWVVEQLDNLRFFQSFEGRLVHRKIPGLLQGY
jgi:hypothetical protein